MSWVSLSGSEAAQSGDSSYKEVAKQAFASPTNLSSRLGHRAGSKEGLNLASSGSSSNRRTPSRINSKEDEENFKQMYHSTAVTMPKKQSNNINSSKPQEKTSSLGEGLKSLANRVSRQYHADLSSTDPEESFSSGDKESFSLGSVSRRTKDLDLANNDNSFHVIGGLIVEFFHSKQRGGNSDLRLTAQDIAQLDRLAPPRVRASFVEAVRYRYTNSPMDSTTSVHMLARQCHDLGLHLEGPNNPLLIAAEAEIVIPVPNAKKGGLSSRASATSSSAASESDPFESIAPSGSKSGSKSGSTSYPSQAATRSDFQQSFVTDASAPAVGPNLGRPPRQLAEDPPGGRTEGASVSTRLTKMGVEVPFDPENASVGNGSSSHSTVTGQSTSGLSTTGQSTENDNCPATSTFHGAVATSLTRFGIEMPKFEAATSGGGEGTSVVSDMKSMATSLTRLGVELPLQDDNAEQMATGSVHSGSDRSNSADQIAQGPAPAKQLQAQSQQYKREDTLPQVETVLSDPAVLSMSKTDDSSILPADSSRDFGNTTGLAKQQLLAELREAQNLMAESKTHEAAKFWRDHVVELEARLRALEGGGDEDSFGKIMKQPTVSVDESIGRKDSNGEPGPFSDGGASRADNPFLRHAVNNYPSNASQVSAINDHTNFDPSLEGVPMVDVVAPADLPGGYHFEAEIEGRRFLATVPAGGVQKGETFSCYMRDLEKVGSDIPVGRWRDGLFDCCSIGCCHPVIWNSLFCPLGKSSQNYDGLHILTFLF